MPLSTAHTPTRILHAAQPGARHFRAQHYFLPYHSVQPGCNIGFNLLEAGTGSVCCLVQGLLPADAGLQLLLSCEHVLCNNLRRRDALLSGALSDTIEMPGPKHQKALHLSGKTIAEVHRFGHVRFGGPPNRIDAAVARILPGIAVETSTVGLGLPITGISAPAAGMEIIKVGSATETQLGRIPDDFRVNAWVDYDGEGDGPVRSAFFTDVVHYHCHCKDGDSGAPVLNAHTYELVGLHFAGTGDEGLFCPIETVFAELALTL